MDQLLGFDERLYLAILGARSQLIGIIAVIVTFANFQGLVWWILGGALMRNRGSGRRGMWVALTIFIGLGLSWVAAEPTEVSASTPSGGPKASPTFPARDEISWI